MATSEKLSFHQAWLCEALRLQETQWGARDDSKARLLASQEQTPQRKIAIRAESLGQDIGLLAAISQLKKAGWIALLLSLIISILAGGLSAKAALGNGALPVNVTWAVLSLIALNILSLLVWCVAMLSNTASGGWLTQFWPWFTRKIARGPNVAIAAQAWWGLWHQANATRWVMSAGTHLLWLIFSLASILMLLALLSTRQYDFVWETTVLAPEIFVNAVKTLGAIPHWLGFAVPDSQVVRLSASVSQPNTETTRILWSSWLIGCIVVYGAIPRACLALLSICILLKRSGMTQPNISTPYYGALLNRITPAFSAPDGAPAALDFISPRGPVEYSVDDWRTENLITAIEPDPNEEWPPSDLGTAVTSTAAVDSNESRQNILLVVSRSKPKRLAITCDARHSPDRGTLRLIADLSHYATRTLIWLRHAESLDAHTAAWRAQINTLHGVEILSNNESQSVMQWFERTHD
jgi:hypothetical protein